MIGKGSIDKQPGIGYSNVRVLIFIGNVFPCEKSQKLNGANASDNWNEQTNPNLEKNTVTSIRNSTCLHKKKTILLFFFKYYRFKDT